MPRAKKKERERSAGERLRDLMTDRGLTQQAAADWLGVSKKSIEAWTAPPAAANYRPLPPVRLAAALAIEGFAKLKGSDASELHSKADALLVDFVRSIAPEVARAYSAAEERIGFLYG